MASLSTKQFHTGRGFFRWRGRTVRAITAGAVVVTLFGSMVASAKTADDPPPSGGGGNTVSDGTNPAAYALSLGAEWSPWSPAPGQFGAVPQAVSFDQIVDGRRTKKIIGEASTNADTASAVLTNVGFTAEDNGKVFAPYAGLEEHFNFTSGAKLDDGSIMLLRFVPNATSAGHSLRVARSTDLGKTWSYWDAPVDGPAGAGRVTRDLLEMPDGTLLQGMYAGTATYLLKSTDQGHTWAQLSQIDDHNKSSELALSWTTDGRLIAITRHQSAQGAEPDPLTVQFSTDDGVSWSDPQPLAAPDGLPNNGIMPQLVLQTNGVLVLTYGRPDNHVLVSWDGTGRTWDAGKLTYSNYIRTYGRGRIMGSSGNTALVPAESNYSLNFGDTCHNLWSCQEYGQLNRIWVRRVDAVTPGIGKIDLAGGVADGTIKLSGDVVAADSRFPEQRLTGAVDGSSERRAAARFAADGATPSNGLTITLDHVYTLNRVGLMLDRGVRNAADVEVSLDGKHWTKPVLTQDSVDYALRYHDIKPVEAKYVRVVRHQDGPLTAVNEIELYAANTWTFENDAVNVTPRGLVDTLHAFTADTVMPGQHSERRMILVDTDEQTRARATFPISATPAVDLSFGFAGEGYGSGAIWNIMGKTADGKDAIGWSFLLAPGSDNTFVLKTFHDNAWQTVGTIPDRPANYQWSSVSATIGAGTATWTINGTSLTTQDSIGDLASITGFQPTTGLNVADTSLEHSYDNVTISPAS